MKKLSYTIFMAGVLLLTSCQKNITELNTNPNLPFNGKFGFTFFERNG